MKAKRKGKRKRGKRTAVGGFVVATVLRAQSQEQVPLVVFGLMAVCRVCVVMKDLITYPRTYGMAFALRYRVEVAFHFVDFRFLLTHPPFLLGISKFFKNSRAQKA